MADTCSLSKYKVDVVYCVVLIDLPIIIYATQDDAPIKCSISIYIAQIL
jgi:hypothetical protein